MRGASFLVKQALKRKKKRRGSHFTALDKVTQNRVVGGKVKPGIASTHPGSGGNGGAGGGTGGGGL